MGSPPELSLDYKPNSYPPAIRKPFDDQPDQTQKLQQFVARLEEERLKIEAFKRELPLCMQLLNNAMETYMQQLEAYQTSQGGARPPVLEEFMPIKQMAADGREKPPNAASEKANWMVSVQLWSPAASDATKLEPPTAQAEQSSNLSPRLALDTKPRNGGGFLPFSKEKNKGTSSTESRVLPDLALAPSEKETEEAKRTETENGTGMGGRRENCSKGEEACGKAAQGKGGSNPTEGQTSTQAHRKARRCWSPELHRRFVSALQILGGSQVATPKQIRELMKVDGLTNDEVKSHLQKYRLHTRRPMPAQQPTAAGAPLLVGIWVPPEYATSVAAGQAIYGAHPPPVHYCASAVPQDFYPAPPPPAAHHHPRHSPLQRSAPSPTAYKGRFGSPESDLRSGGERSESIEEEEEGKEEEEYEEAEG